MAIVKRLKYNWSELNRHDKTDIMTVAVMKNIFIRGNNHQVGLREINVNIGKNKSNLRIDVLQIDRNKNDLDGYEIKSCIQDFRTDKKWHKYLDLINRLYFVFDSETYKKYEDEIIEKIGNRAGIYVYNITGGYLTLKDGCKYTELPPKNEEFYRKILFNYLYRKAMNEVNMVR
jgi:translation elongation factor P/translation initiation factor 5A